MAPPRRTLIVANLTAATPLLLDEVKRRARERPTSFTLLVPAVESKHADWTLAEAIPMLERAAGGAVQGLPGGADPFESVRGALEERAFDDVLISTLPKRTSEWLRRDLPSRVKRLGVPVEVITAAKEPPTSVSGAPGPPIG